MNAGALTTRLSASVESVLYRVAQEAVRNATRHAAPGHVWLTLHADDASARLEVHDDGRGFNPQGPDGAKAGRLGLIGIRERTKSLGGKLSLSSQPGQGTEVVVTVSLPG